MASKNAETLPPNVLDPCNCEMFKNHEKTLPTMEDLGNHVTEFLLRTKGKNKMAKKMDKLTEAVKKDLSKPEIVNYLAELRAEYKSREDHIRKICPRHLASQDIPPISLVSEVSAVVVTVPETSSTLSDTGVIPWVDTEIVGPNLSESDESEKEAEEDEEGATNEKIADNPLKSPTTTTLSIPFLVPSPAETVAMADDNKDTDKENVEKELTEDANKIQSSEELQQQDAIQKENLNIIRSCGLELSDEDDILQLDYGYDENDTIY